jgi:hypothetical protein
MSAHSLETIIVRQARRTHFPTEEPLIGAIYVELGDMSLLSVLCCKNLKLPLRHPCVIFVSLWGMM